FGFRILFSRSRNCRSRILHFWKKDHSKRYATFAVLAGCIFAFFTILPLVSMIKSAKQKAEIMRELETTRDFTIED
ncbi:MAG: hypothetical protein ACPGQC_14980, partial [Limisphaerales bacterium]